MSSASAGRFIDLSRSDCETGGVPIVQAGAPRRLISVNEPLSGLTDGFGQGRKLTLSVQKQPSVISCVGSKLFGQVTGRGNDMQSRFLLFAALLVAPSAWSTDFGPWRFGMSKDEVRSFKEFGPYKQFSNGDLETYQGIFEGRKEDFQFFFSDTGLRRVGIYLYEGTDMDVATQKRQYAYDALASKYGAIEIPGGRPGLEDSAALREALLRDVRSRIAGGQKVQMAPVRQPPGLYIYSSSWSAVANGVTYYYVVVNADPPRDSR